LTTDKRERKALVSFDRQLGPDHWQRWAARWASMHMPFETDRKRFCKER
jgi:hypothetical protein